MKKLFYIDMDGVLCDFRGSSYFQPGDPVTKAPARMYEFGFFENLPLMDGALWGVRSLIKNENLDIFILSQPVKESSISYTEKANWINKWFPELNAKIILTQNKEHLSAPGRILVDDAKWKWGEAWEKQGGEFLHFNVKSNDPYYKNEHQNGVDSPREMWEKIVHDWRDWEPTEPNGADILKFPGEISI